MIIKEEKLGRKHMGQEREKNETEKNGGKKNRKLIYKRSHFVSRAETKRAVARKQNRKENKMDR